MGNNLSLASGGIPEAHMRIYRNLLQIQSPATRVQMLETLLAGQEYVATAKKTGLYAPLLGYVAAIKRGEYTNLPGEGQQQRSPENQVAKRQGGDVTEHTKAISFFGQCLQVLGLEEEVALNEDSLKAAYKKASMRAHPDRGGNEEAFDAVTRAYAYLGDILRRVRGGRSQTVNMNEQTPAKLTNTRDASSSEWKLAEPVKLNPKSLNMDTFNKVFEQTRLPDPDEDGYGDWLKTAEQNSAANQKFSGKFNRSVFNEAFENEVKSRASNQPQNRLAVAQPQALTMAPRLGIELGREKPDDFTASAMNGLQYTDLKKAYTTDSTFSHQVADVNVSNRSFDAAATERKSAPTPLSSAELEAIQEGERRMATNQQRQASRIVDEDRRVAEYFSRMQRYVITNQ